MVFETLGHYVSRYPRRILAFWLVLFFVCLPFARQVGGVLTTEGNVAPGSVAQQLRDLVAREYGVVPRFQLLLVGDSASLANTSADYQARFDQVADSIAALSVVSQVNDYRSDSALPLLSEHAESRTPGAFRVARPHPGSAPPRLGCRLTLMKPRIIGGTAKGRPLETPKSGTRPTPARVREALFDILAFYPRGRFLDLFAGSGAVGFEAASRGWTSTLVELDRRAAQVLRRNAHTLKLPAEVVQDDALRFALAHPGAFDVVFAAPPYPLELVAVFQQILDASVAKAGGLYVFQHPSQLSLELSVGGEKVALERRAYGSNVLSLHAFGAAEG